MLRWMKRRRSVSDDYKKDEGERIEAKRSMMWMDPTFSSHFTVARCPSEWTDDCCYSEFAAAAVLMYKGFLDFVEAGNFVVQAHRSRSEMAVLHVVNHQHELLAAAHSLHTIDTDQAAWAHTSCQYLSVDLGYRMSQQRQVAEGNSHTESRMILNRPEGGL